MTDDELTYALIEGKIDQYVKKVTDDKPGRVERAAFLTAFIPWSDWSALSIASGGRSTGNTTKPPANWTKTTMSGGS
jgi:hypothetical protein